MDERTDVTRTTEAEVVLSRQQLAVASERHERGRVRVAKRVVTEERTVTVTVRREVLVVEDVATGTDISDLVVLATGSGPTGPASGTATGSPPVLELTLMEEQVRLVAVPVERVRVHVDQVTERQQVAGTVAREDVQLTTIPDEHDPTDQGAPS